MTQWTDNVIIRAGATPLTFDGNATIRFNAGAKRMTGISLGHSVSVLTTDEGYAMAVRLSENAGLPSKAPVFIMGQATDSGPTTNHAVQSAPQDYLGLDIAVAGNSTMRVDITTIAGAVQTGTHDISLTIHYDDGTTPNDILFAASAARGLVPVKGGSFGTVTALATTTETALVGNGTTLNVPEEAKEIVGIQAVKVLDTAVTATEEIGGKVRLEFSGIPEAAKQEYPLSGGTPNLGTEVDGANPVALKALPMHLTCPPAEVQISGFITFLSAITGGADVAVNLLWR